MDTQITDRPVVVVSGLPRSGTSMLMQMLVAGGLEALTDERRIADQDNPAGYFEYDRVKTLQRDNEWLNEARGKVVKIVVPLVAFLPPDLPYRIVFMLRELEEVVKSQTTMLQRLNNQGARMPPEMLARQFELLLEKTRATLESTYGDNIIFVEHRRCLEATPEVVAELRQFLGKHLDAEKMEHAVNPALYRNKLGSE